MASLSQTDARIAAVRRFNRFYTRQVGALDEHHLHSDFSLSEARILYEIAHQPKPAAREIAAALFLDKGYLSRVLAGFARRGFIKKVHSSDDGRESILKLTAKGRALFSRLNEKASAEVAAMLDAVPPAGQPRLIEAMATIETFLGSIDPASPAFTIREHRPGDMGWIIERHAQIYTDEYNWNSNFETLVTEIGAKFLRDLKPDRERCWIAERNGVNVGCVLMVERSKSVAQLRLLLVEPSARGLGIGNSLVNECIAFARSAGYRTMRLWTNDVLLSARKIYQAAGFELIEEEVHNKFGPSLTSQTWEMRL
jgi:DNA-binding MarR family transcriptional regulator/N-acetylglutamate synthase-like GNAT family acetyltransferase